MFHSSCLLSFNEQDSHEYNVSVLLPKCNVERLEMQCRIQILPCSDPMDKEGEKNSMFSNKVGVGERQI